MDYGRLDAYFVDEGYEGRQALKAHGIDPALGDLPGIEVTPRQYRALLKGRRSA